MVPVLLTTIIGIYQSITLPRIYQSSTTIQVQPQKMPDDVAVSLVSTDVSARINSTLQNILSRTNIEKIIKEFDLLSSDSSGLYLEEKVNIIKKRIVINNKRQRRNGANSFTVAYKSSDPEKTMHVANALALDFLDEILKVNQATVMGTKEFIEAELQKTKAKLEKHEEEISQFRKKYIGGLPEELNTSLRTLDRLQEELRSNQESIFESNNLKTNMEAQLLNLKKSERILKKTIRPAEETQNPEIFAKKELLKTLKNDLTSFMLKYTDKHPDIIKFKKKISILEVEIKNEKKQLKKTSKNVQVNPELKQISENKSLLKSQIEQIILEINNLQQNILTIKQKMKDYQLLVENTPKREQELAKLNRDYLSIRDSYNVLLGRKLKADISVSMERKQKGEQFTVIDRAVIQKKPISPDIRKVALFSIAAGFAIGGGIIFLLEFLNPPFRKTEDIESYLGLNVLVSIPLIKSHKDKMKRRMNRIFSCVMLVCVLTTTGLLGIFVLLGVEDTIQLAKNGFSIIF